MNLFERLRDARAVSGLSQGQVAKRLGMHRPTISEIEAGRRKVSAEELGRFASVYGVSVEWLMGEGNSKGAENDARIVIAARELSKMSDKDIERLMKMLRMLRKP
jgi:transcriptional regulator with XRE-family HTH domain